MSVTQISGKIAVCGVVLKCPKLALGNLDAKGFAGVGHIHFCQAELRGQIPGRLTGDATVSHGFADRILQFGCNRRRSVDSLAFIAAVTEQAHLASRDALFQQVDVDTDRSGLAFQLGGDGMGRRTGDATVFHLFPNRFGDGRIDITVRVLGRVVAGIFMCHWVTSSVKYGLGCSYLFTGLK